MDGNSQQSTKTSGILKDELDYSEDSKLNIVCDEDGSHTSVLYCAVCKTNLCRICADRIHLPKTLSTHQIVRLSEKPESPIKCPIHPLKKAKLICKEMSCDGMNNPMCTMCHQYESHKGHKYEMLDDEYDKIREKVGNCSKEIEENKAICDKILEDYDNCISTYSKTDSGFVKSERDKIKKFYSEAEASALKKFDDFAKDRVEKLKILKDQYISEKLELNIMSLEVRKIEEMRKMELIENGGSVEELMRLSAKQIEKPTDIVPCEDYIVKYPSVEAIKIEIDLPEHIRLKNQPKTVAVWFMGYESAFSYPSEYHLEVEHKDVGSLCKYKDGRTMLELKQGPNDNDIIDLIRYKYVCVMYFKPGNEDDRKIEFQKTIRKGLWISIIILIDVYDWKNVDFMARIRQLAETDKRVEVVKYEGIRELVDVLTQK